MKQQLSNTHTWTVREVVLEAPLVYSLILESTGTRPHFISGQYLTVRLPGFEPAEGKSYSISSTEEDEFVRLTIKEIGMFSKALIAHKEGDSLTTSSPYGFFYPEQTSDRDLVFIAGGIGITPCMSIIETLAKEGYPRNVFLFYSNRTVADTIFKDELQVLQNSFPRLFVTYHLTREPNPPLHYTSGRITGESIVASLPTPHGSDYFVCGSIDFTKGIWGELRKASIESAQIYTEGYF